MGRSSGHDGGKTIVCRRQKSSLVAVTVPFYEVRGEPTMLFRGSGTILVPESSITLGDEAPKARDRIERLLRDRCP
jgi:hypothetical protein